MLGKILDTVIGGLIRNMPGGAGQRIRALYWRCRFRSCGRVKIDEGVIFHNPGQIEIGDNVWIMAYSVLTAPAGDPTGLNECKNISDNSHRVLKIGDEVQVGLYNVINATGGLTICDCVTLSARVSIYSATHLPRNPDDFAAQVGCNGMVRRYPVFSKQRSITIGEGAWLGLHSVVICCDVGAHAFVTSGTILARDLREGMQALPDGTSRPRYREGAST